GTRCSSAAFTSSTDCAATSALLVEESLGGVVDLDLAGVRRRRADREALPAGADRLLQLVEQDLEAPEPLVEEVLGLVTQATRVGFGGFHHLSGALFCGAHDFGPLHHPLGA